MATNQPVSVPVVIKLKTPAAPTPKQSSSPSKTKRKVRHAISKQKQQDPVIIRKQTPCLLPPLEEISSVRTEATAQGYWDLELDFEHKPELAAQFRRNQCLHLRQRPLHEGVFGATLRALGRDTLAGDNSNTSAAGGAISLSGAGGGRDPLEWVFDQSALSGLTHAERAMVLDRRGGGEGGSEEAAATEVDARLVLEGGLDGWSRDKLEGLRLLFEWAEARGVSGVNKQAAQAVEGEDKEGGGGGGSSAEEGGWWLRDSVVEMLKGKAWLAACEEGD
jgi:anaphase-promoting complex subunit 1